MTDVFGRLVQEKGQGRPVPLRASKPGSAEDTGSGPVTCGRLLSRPAPPPPRAPSSSPGHAPFASPRVREVRTKEEGGDDSRGAGMCAGNWRALVLPRGPARGRCAQESPTCSPPVETPKCPREHTFPFASWGLSAPTFQPPKIQALLVSGEHADKRTPRPPSPLGNT